MHREMHKMDDVVKLEATDISFGGISTLFGGLPIPRYICHVCVLFCHLMAGNNYLCMVNDKHILLLQSSPQILYSNL